MSEIRKRRREIHNIGKEICAIKCSRKDNKDNKDEKDDKDDNDDNDDKDEKDNCIITDIEKKMIGLKKNEPSSDNQFFRLCIISYEMGLLIRSLVYAERFKNDDVQRRAHLKNAELECGDLLTQIHMLCLSYEWEFEKLRELGLLHLEERQREFMEQGWSEVK